MQVRNGLCSVATVVGREPIAGLGEILGLRHRYRDGHHPTQQLLIVAKRVHARHVPTRGDQYVRRRLRVDVAEGNHMVVRIDLITRYVAAGDGAEDAVARG